MTTSNFAITALKTFKSYDWSGIRDSSDAAVLSMYCVAVRWQVRAGRRCRLCFGTGKRHYRRHTPGGVQQYVKPCRCTAN